MNSGIDGAPFVSSFTIAHEDGSPIDVLSATYSLFNRSDAVLISPTAISNDVLFDPVITITTPPEVNVLDAGELSSIRRITLTIVEVNGSITQLDQFYVIHGTYPLSFMVNSYQTIQEAMLTAYNIPNLMAFGLAPMTDKYRALKEAFVRLGMMTYSVDFNYLGGTLNYVTETNTMTSGNNPNSNLGRRSVVVNKINLLPIGYVNSLPAIFMSKLKVAQVIEANFILNGDVESDDRVSGVLSKKVGESTTTWRQSKPLILPVCKAALESLRGHIYYGSQIGRG